MVGTNFSEIDCNLFDNKVDLYEYDNIFNYPINVDASSLQFPVENWYSLANIWPNEYDSVISGNTSDLYLPSNDILSLEWLSNNVDDSFCEESLIEKKLEQQPASSVNKEDFVLLESSSSHTGGKTTVRRTRSKRPRPATFNPSLSIMQLISTTSSFVGENMQTSVISTKAVSSENFLEYQITKEKPKLSSVESKKKKKTKAPLPAAPGDEHALVPVKKCTHCEMTKTPQWRAGPKGPKTLCNACGVRFKSGRLCAEYRPAASPTFCPYLHSNSHKKILEMRRRNKNSGILALEYI